MRANHRVAVGFWLGLTVATAGEPGLADPVDEAIGRWDTEAAREFLPRMDAADARALARWGLVFFLDGDYSKAEEVWSGIPSPRAQTASLLRLVRETRHRVRGFIETSSPDGRFRVSVSPGPDEMAVPYLLEAAEAAYDDLSRRFGSAPAGPIRVEVAPTLDAFAALAGLDEEALRTTGTVAVCRYRKVMLLSPAEFPHGYPYADAVAHEMVHFFWIARAGEGLPVWFQEAVAKYLETAWRGEPPGTLSSGLKSLLTRALVEGRLLPIQTLIAPLTSLGRAEDVALAYAELSSFAGFLVQNHGPDVLVRLGDRLARPGSGDPVSEVTGRSLKALSDDWARDGVAAGIPAVLGGVADPLVLLREPDDAIRAELPSSAGERVRLGDLLRSEGRMDAAAVRYREALAALPAPHPIVVARLAAALTDAGRPAEALAEVVRSGLAEDWFPPLARERGRALVLLDRPGEALTSLLSFVRTNPYDPAVHEGLARVWDAMGQPALAERERRLARFWR